MTAPINPRARKDHLAMSTLLFAVIKRRLVVFAVVAACWSVPYASAGPAASATFASPEQAADSLVAAFRSSDPAELLEIFGPAGQDLVSSGDKIADKNAHARFVERYAKGNKITRDGADRAILVIGSEEWPFPIPIVADGSLWHFDVEAGAQEIINRRIGHNELHAIDVCRSYVLAQQDYAADLENAKKPKEYARKVVSSPNQRDGLYWPVQPGETESPMGPLMAKAQAEGYDPASHKEGQHEPYHGYSFKILTRQGAAAPGGARDYVVDGHMTGGFALVSYPAKYGDSGVATFIVDQDGIVFEKDLGPDTPTLAPALTEFNPDSTWKTRP